MTTRARLDVQARDDALGEHHFFQWTLPLVDWSSPEGRVAWRSAMPNGLERRLVDVVEVLPAVHEVVERDPRLEREAPEEVLQHLVGEIDLAVRDGRPWSTLTVTSASSIGIVAVPTRWIGRPSSASAQRLADRQRDVLDDVVVEVARRLDLEVELAESRHRLQHVLEPLVGEVDGVLPRAVQVELDRDVGLLGLPADALRAAHEARAFALLKSIVASVERGAGDDTIGPKRL